MARFVPDNRKLAIIIGASIGVHGVIAVMALMGDPIVERPVLAATSGRIFLPDEVDAQYVFDVSTMPAIAPPIAPHVAAPVPAPSPSPSPPAPAVHAHASPSRLAEADPKRVVDGLFADNHGLDLATRHPGDDLQRQIDEAHRHADNATIGNPALRDPGDTAPRIGTGPPCACDSPRVGTFTPPTTPPPDRLPPPIVHVDPKPTVPTSLSPDDVLAIVTSRYMAGLQRCQLQLARTQGDASGKVDLELTIDGDGAIADVAADGVDPSLDRCIEARAGGWHFPAPRDPKTGEGMTARYRLSLALQAK